MHVKAGYSTPLLHVSDVERSVRFYALLGFETVDVLIGHWGQQEHESWERERAEKRAAGLFPTSDRPDA